MPAMARANGPGEHCSPSAYEDRPSRRTILDRLHVVLFRSIGIIEDFHRKKKLIQRRAFGFRNFENRHI